MPNYPVIAGDSIAFGVAAARPPASPANTGTGWYATDTGELTVSNGVTWNALKQTSNASFGVSSGLVNFTPNGNAFQASSLGGAVLLGPGVDVTTVGGGIAVKEGANAKQGTFVMNGTTNVVVGNTSVTANSRILFSLNAISGAPGIPGIVSRVPGTSFTVVSTAATDLGTYAYEMFEPG